MEVGKKLLISTLRGPFAENMLRLEGKGAHDEESENVIIRNTSNKGSPNRHPKE